MLSGAQSWSVGGLPGHHSTEGTLAFSLTWHRAGTNGVEFLNAHLVSYCQQEQLTFTRSRPYKKNDQAYVEQKNWSIVRHLVGYARDVGQKSWDALQNLYDVVRLYTNFFQPSMKLLSKERVGGKVKKKYDEAKTPYQRVLADGHVAKEVKEQLQQEYRKLNPLALLRQMRGLQAALWELALSDAAVPAVVQAIPESAFRPSIGRR
jgi:hypothetical protein